MIEIKNYFLQLSISTIDNNYIRYNILRIAPDPNLICSHSKALIHCTVTMHTAQSLILDKMTGLSTAQAQCSC